MNERANRLADVVRLYELLELLEANLGAKRTLSAYDNRANCPARGIYFFFEPGELRSDSGAGARVVRVGTHATAVGVKSRLRGRLSQHRGSVKSGGGNHRSSIMRLLIGTALKERDPALRSDSWGVGQNSTKARAKLGLSGSELREREHRLESAVTAYLGAMPFLWLSVDDEAGPHTDRGVIERNTLALLSNYSRSPIDPGSTTWLGQFCDRERVRRSGLWNNNHVDEEYDPRFLDILKKYVTRTTHSL